MVMALEEDGDAVVDHQPVDGLITTGAVCGETGRVAPLVGAGYLDAAAAHPVDVVREDKLVWRGVGVKLLAEPLRMRIALDIKRKRAAGCARRHKRLLRTGGVAVAETIVVARVQLEAREQRFQRRGRGGLLQRGLRGVSAGQRSNGAARKSAGL